MEDQHEKRRIEKKERIDKNARRARRNTEERSAVLVGKDPRSIRKKQLEVALTQSKKSTASLGKFDKALTDEDKVKIKSNVKRKVGHLSFAHPDC